jgi:hypothetical protein
VVERVLSIGVEYAVVVAQRAVRGVQASVACVHPWRAALAPAIRRAALTLLHRERARYAAPGPAIRGPAPGPAAQRISPSLGPPSVGRRRRIDRP